MRHNIFETTSSYLPHERLDVYKVACEAATQLVPYIARLKRIPGDLADHVTRSSVSLITNVAEAGGRVHTRDRKARFAIARGEACEISSALDVAIIFGVMTKEEIAPIRLLLVRVSQMLGKLAY